MGIVNITNSGINKYLSALISFKNGSKVNFMPLISFLLDILFSSIIDKFTCNDCHRNKIKYISKMNLLDRNNRKNRLYMSLSKYII